MIIVPCVARRSGQPRREKRATKPRKRVGETRFRGFAARFSLPFSTDQNAEPRRLWLTIIAKLKLRAGMVIYHFIFNASSCPSMMYIQVWQFSDIFSNKMYWRNLKYIVVVVVVVVCTHPMIWSWGTNQNWQDSYDNVSEKLTKLNFNSSKKETPRYREL